MLSFRIRSSLFVIFESKRDLQRVFQKMNSGDNSCVLGVDVGSESVRVALINARSGQFAGIAEQPIEMCAPETGYFTQSSENIFEAVSLAIKSLRCNFERLPVKGIGFDATCSLVVLDRKGRPLSVSHRASDSKSCQNVIMWCDQRASIERSEIEEMYGKLHETRKGNVTISVEMQLPKVLWLRKHMPATWWDRVGYIFDLPDFLTFRITGKDTRSHNSLLCKWSFANLEAGTIVWDREMLEALDLADIIRKYVGTKSCTAGIPIAHEIHPEIAHDLGVNEAIEISVSVIDAHAGILACLDPHFDLSETLIIIAGSSACYLRLNDRYLDVPGIWRPIRGCLFDDLYLYESGITAAGMALDRFITTHPAYAEIVRLAAARNTNIYDVFETILEKERANRNHMSIYTLTDKVHVLPDIRGNRSPFNTPDTRGMITGFGVSTDVTDLAILYLAVLQSIALQGFMTSELFVTKTIVMWGGLGTNKHFRQINADIFQANILVPVAENGMVLGSAMLAAAASGFHPNLRQAIVRMKSAIRTTIAPNDNQPLQQFYRRKFKILQLMYAHQTEYDTIAAAPTQQHFEYFEK